MRAALFALSVGITQPGLVNAQTELSVYGGLERSADSQVSGRDPLNTGAFSFTSAWDDQSLTDAANYGLRVTWWQNDSVGWGLAYSRSSMRADDGVLLDNNLTSMNFSDGLNLFTLNAFRRWPAAFDGITPYVGGGIGFAVPRIDYGTGTSRTSEYQVTGPALNWMAGASYPLNETLSVFGEYQGSYSVNSFDLQGGGNLDTRILTGAVNLGLSLGF